MGSYDAPFRTFAADVRSESKQVGARVALAVRRTATAIQADAQAMAPVDTGALRSSISTDVATGADGASATIGPTVNYAEYVEFGTSRMSAQPYLFPAADRHEPGFLTAMMQAATGTL